MRKMTIGETRVRRLLDIAQATGREWALVVSVVDGRKSIYASPDGLLTHMLEPRPAPALGHSRSRGRKTCLLSRRRRSRAAGIGPA
jgi:hypothetical protein